MDNLVDNIIVLGIDPGWKTGAISIYHNNVCLGYNDMPNTTKELVEYIRIITVQNPDGWYACIELIHSFPGFDIMSQEDLIRNHQTWITLLEEYAKGYIQVSPVRWQNSILGKIDHTESDSLKVLAKAQKDKKLMDRAKKRRKDETKNASVLKAKQFYSSGIYEIVGPKGGIHRMDGRADAVNIGMFGYNHFLQEGLFK